MSLLVRGLLAHEKALKVCFYAFATIKIPSSVQPPVMDENECIALLEKEDERLARELEAREHSGGNLEVQYDQNVCPVNNI